MNDQPATSKIKIVLFCGGRGSTALIQEVIRNPDYQLALIINAYDDGLSTGALRSYIPGFLGPSDFRKNIATTFVSFSSEYINLNLILEFRIPELSKVFYSSFTEITVRNPELIENLKELSGRTQSLIREYTDEFFSFQRTQSEQFNFADCSLGNLIFAGAYLKAHQDFQTANNLMCKLFGSQAIILNISNENAYLAAILNDGTILKDEESIVSSRSNSSNIENLILTKYKIDSDKLMNLPLSERFLTFNELNYTPKVNSQALEFLNSADIIIFGAGTQHSSLFPSYKVLKENGYKLKEDTLKIFITNLDKDHDIENFTLQELLDKFHFYWGYKETKPLIDVILTDPESPYCADALRENIVGRRMQMSLRNSKNRQIHSGFKLFKEILEIHDQFMNSGRVSEITIRSCVVIPFDMKLKKAIIEREFSDIIWPYPNKLDLILSQSTDSDLMDQMKKWYFNSTEDFFIGSCGDGQYFFGGLSEIFRSLNWYNPLLVITNRFESRIRWREEINSSFGQSRIRYYTANLGSIFLNIILLLKFNKTFQDPFSKTFVVNRLTISKLNISAEEWKGLTPFRFYLCCWYRDINVLNFKINYRADFNSNKMRNAIYRGIKDAIEVIKYVQK